MLNDLSTLAAVGFVWASLAAAQIQLPTEYPYCNVVAMQWEQGEFVLSRARESTRHCTCGRRNEADAGDAGQQATALTLFRSVSRLCDLFVLL